MSSDPVGALRLRAPAKLNLGLRITGVREDGYHLLESVFVPLELADEVEIAIEPGGFEIALRVEDGAESGMSGALAEVPAGPGNLAFRAAEALARERGYRGRIRIRLGKRIPAAAGLGGGSSDAAAVLRGLAALLDGVGGSGLSRGGGADAGVLEKLALGLGADVPYFLAPEPAIVRGIGERIEPLPGLPALDVVLANPGVSLATAEVYRAADALAAALTPRGPGSTMAAISRLCRNEGDLEEALGGLLVNDLEPAARRLCPPVARLSERLRQAGAVAVGMTGSGATVFGVFHSGGEAAEAADRIRGTDAGEPPAGAPEEPERSRAEARPWVAVTRTGRAGREG